jgi:hypothetical protein
MQYETEVSGPDGKYTEQLTSESFVQHDSQSVVVSVLLLWE